MFLCANIYVAECTLDTIYMHTLLKTLTGVILRIIKKSFELYTKLNRGCSTLNGAFDRL